jgi:hypothetical protein
MEYALLYYPDIGNRRPSAMKAEIRSLRFETSALDLLFLALFIRRLPPSIPDHLTTGDHKTATEMATHAGILRDARNAMPVATIANSFAAVLVRSASLHDSRSPVCPARSPDCCREGNHQPPCRPTPGPQDNRSNNTNSRMCFYFNKFDVKAPCGLTEN